MKRSVSRRSGRGSASAPSAEDSWQSASLDRTRRSIAEAIGDLEAATLEAHPGFRRGDPTPGDVRPALDKILLASSLRDSAFMIHAGGSSEEEANAAEFRELLDRAERAVSEARALTRAVRASASKHERGENPRVVRPGVMRRRRASAEPLRARDAGWRAEVDEIAGPGIPLYVPMLVSPDGSVYKYRPLKAYRDALSIATKFASSLNDPSASVLLHAGEWKVAKAGSAAPSRAGASARDAELQARIRALVGKK